MSDELDWLSDLVPKAEEASPAETSPEDVDLLDDLRDEMILTEAEPAVVAEKLRPQRSVGGMLPWQVFFLSVMMFLDIAVVGFLFLVILGRVVIP
jgi:hypothetical protein